MLTEWDKEKLTFSTFFLYTSQQLFSLCCTQFYCSFSYQPHLDLEKYGYGWK